MKLISFDDVRSLGIPPELCYEWVSDMIANKQNAFLPAKVHMSMPGNIFCNVMPCLVPEKEQTWGGMKIVTRYPERVPSLNSKILIFNANTGKFLALMDGNWITAMRTGAVATHSILRFAKKDFSVLGMIGLGNVARSCLLSLASIEKDRAMTVKLLRYKDQAELFAERFRDFPNLSFQIVETAEDCIRGSDVVISCATYFDKDIASDDYFDEGILVVPVHTRGFTNCDLFFDKVYADDTAHVSDFRNFSKFRYYAEVCDVVNGNAVGRENDKERILAYNIGIALHDVNFAAHVYRSFEARPELFAALTEADMHDPEEKFWI